MGVVVNRESPLLLSRPLPGPRDPVYAGDDRKLVRAGGPVQPEHGLVLYGIRARRPRGAGPFSTDLHVSASRGPSAADAQLPAGRFHCYSGYAGWGPGPARASRSTAGEPGSSHLACAATSCSRPSPAGNLDERMTCGLLGIDPAATGPRQRRDGLSRDRRLRQELGRGLQLPRQGIRRSRSSAPSVPATAARRGPPS